MTLRDLSKVTWNITRVYVYARDENGLLIGEFRLGEDARRLGQGQIRAYEDGSLVVYDGNINHHNEDTKRGPEMGWWLDEAKFPEEILDAEIWHLSMTDRSSGSSVSIHIITNPLALEAAKQFYRRL